MDERPAVCRAAGGFCRDRPAPPVRRRARAESTRPDHCGQGFHPSAGRADKGRQLHRMVVSARRWLRPCHRDDAGYRRRGTEGGAMKTGLVAAALALVLAPARADARVWVVGPGDSDFPLISPAVAAAADGDEIRIRAGVYREDIVLDKQLSLVGEGRPVLFGTGNGTVIDVVADGCTI